MQLHCARCGRVNDLTAEDERRIRVELVRSGPGANHTVECTSCHRYQFSLILRPVEPRWELSERNV